MAAAKTDVPRNKEIDEWVAKGKSGDFMGVLGADPWKVVLTADLEFVDKSRYLYTFLLTRLNTHLHGKSIGIEGCNGLELYRQIVQSVDQSPENAKFLMGADLSNVVHKYGDKVKHLKFLYGFRLLLKKLAAEYKTMIGRRWTPRS